MRILDYNPLLWQHISHYFGTLKWGQPLIYLSYFLKHNNGFILILNTYSFLRNIITSLSLAAFEMIKSFVLIICSFVGFSVFQFWFEYLGFVVVFADSLFYPLVFIKCS